MKHCVICGSRTANEKHDLCRKCWLDIQKSKRYSSEEKEGNYEKIRSDERLSWDNLDTSIADYKTRATYRNEYGD